MASQTPNENGFLNLWPTQFLQRSVPNADSANSVLLDLVLELEQKYNADVGKSDVTSDYLSQSFLAVEHPVIDWLKGCINKSVGDYLKEQGIDFNVDWGLQAWPNINRRGDYHNLHNHPHSYLSGTYYVAMPAQYDHSARNDLNPGAISFYDPRAQANMQAIRGDGQVDPEHRVLPSSGMLLLWPSFLHHFVHPNTSDALRVSISFNVVLKWRDEYLPI